MAYIMRTERSFLKRDRADYIKDSNNPVNPRKNLCALEIAKAFHVDKTVIYLHTIDDLLRALRKKWRVRSRLSYVKGRTVGAIRKEIPKNKKLDFRYYLVMVPGHVLVLDRTGKTMIDTAPRKRDVRKVWKLYGIKYR